MQGVRASDTLVTIAEVIRPNEANFLGKLFGGELLAKIDLCAYAASAKHSGGVCVTASFDQVDFHEPIEVGELVTLTGQIVFVGRTSMEVIVEVVAENLRKGIKRHTNTARVTMVSLKDGVPAEVPRLVCETREEKIRFLQGQQRRDARKKLREERLAAYDRIEHMSDAELDAALAG
ncbi:MAG: acyl-CoA thioesterase [Armatimonadetes bacterium]|nr:acyl-CoA thioesterase [Armatimonadota bacterium]MBS1701541.1 acyl-CoA thioesterase [Armatimonadota bacterium]MBS1725716.1 acyl-CoA thioesterase [Armatimonadota bacterium]